jgi:hypothetical protein
MVVKLLIEILFKIRSLILELLHKGRHTAKQIRPLKIHFGLAKNGLRTLRSEEA